MIWFRALPLLWQLGIELTLIIGLCTAFAVWKHGIYMHGWDDAMVKVKAADEKGKDTHGKIEVKIMRLSDPDLDGRLARWMRDK